MLRSVKDHEKCTDGATNGDIGQVKDFYFDDHAWAGRGLAVNTSDCDFANRAQAAAADPQTGN